MNTLDPGQEFDRLPDTYVIFITWTDTLGRGLPIYHIGRTIEETGECFRDGSYISYVNVSVQAGISSCPAKAGQEASDVHPM